MTDKHYVLELKIIEVTNETTTAYNQNTRSNEKVRTGNRTMKDIVNLHLSDDSLARAIGSAAEHLMVVGKRYYPEGAEALKQVTSQGVGSVTTAHAGVAHARPIKDNPQA